MKVTVIKVGGKIVETPESLERLLLDFAALPAPKVLVHGGGRTATEMAARMGIATQMIEGRRVTDAEMLRVVTMVYAGLVNKNLVARLQAEGVNALGMTGADMNVIQAHRRPLCNGVDYGFVGDVDRADGQRLKQLLSGGVVPVVAPITHDGHGTLLNTNADTIASEVAKSLAAEGMEVTLIYCFEHAGVLTDPSDEESVIPHLSRADFERLKANGTLSGGMIPKVENALRAIDEGVRRVVITRADAIDGFCGTSIS